GALPVSALAESVRPAGSEFGINPSWITFRQLSSKLRDAGAAAACAGLGLANGVAAGLGLAAGDAPFCEGAAPLAAPFSDGVAPLAAAGEGVAAGVAAAAGAAGVRFCVCQYSLTISMSRFSKFSCMKSCAISYIDLPPYSGSINGCIVVTVPSNARASPHISRKCFSGTCQWQISAVSSK